MTLEDHAGDVVRKARAMTGATPEAAAQAAGISTADLTAFEGSGKAPANIKWEPLGALLQLDGRKLAIMAGGWMPAPVDLGNWRELRQITTNGPEYSVNCFIVWDEVTRDAALFDTGFDEAPIFALIDENQLQLKHIFLTHSHQDHIACLGKIRERFTKVRVHSGSKNAPVEQRIRANDFIHLGSLRITNRDTPGHAEDGVTYVIGTFPEDAPNAVIVGDALFAGSIGTGFQSWDLAKQKIREQIFSLPKDALICSGHGPLTTVGEQIATNPFFPGLK